MKRQTQILCTLGPASESEEMIRALAQEGANIMLHGLGDAMEVDGQRAALATEMGDVVGYHDADLSRFAEVERLMGIRKRNSERLIFW